MIRVLVAEDSVTVRELLVAILKGDPDFEVVGQAKNGLEAVELAKTLEPDLITMDVHMPGMDGFLATKEIMVVAPTPIIIVSSSSKGAEVDLSLNALRAGALMVVPKPDQPNSPLFNGRQGHFLAMAKAMAEVKVVRRWRGGGAGTKAGSQPFSERERVDRVEVVAIATSTGGPAALQCVLGGLPPDFPLPILVVQHIAQGFTEGLADWLAGSLGLHVRVAVDGEPLAPRTVLLAPDDRHLGVRGDRRISVVEAPPVGGFRPSATYLFDSVARSVGSGVVAAILTGMGSDGVVGLEAVRREGGYVIAQNEETSVVYGMPGVAVDAGHANAVLPLEEIAGRLTQLVRETQRGATDVARPNRGGGD